MLAAMSSAVLRLILFALQVMTMTISILPSGHKTCSIWSPPTPRLTNFVKYFFNTQGHLMRHASIESPIITIVWFVICNNSLWLWCILNHSVLLLYGVANNIVFFLCHVRATISTTKKWTYPKALGCTAWWNLFKLKRGNKRWIFSKYRRFNDEGVVLENLQKFYN